MSVRSFQRAYARRVDRERRRLATAKRRGRNVAGMAFSASAVMAGTAQATTFTVANTNASGAGSLAAAIALALTFWLIRSFVVPLIWLLFLRLRTGRSIVAARGTCRTP